VLGYELAQLNKVCQKCTEKLDSSQF